MHLILIWRFLDVAGSNVVLNFRIYSLEKHFYSDTWALLPISSKRVFLQWLSESHIGWIIISDVFSCTNVLCCKRIYVYTIKHIKINSPYLWTGQTCDYGAGIILKPLSFIIYKQKLNYMFMLLPLLLS